MKGKCSYEMKLYKAIELFLLIQLAISYIYVCIGFTTKIKVKTDEEMELGSKGPLDDNAAEPNMYVNPEVVEEAADPKNEQPAASNGNQLQHNTYKYVSHEITEHIK